MPPNSLRLGRSVGYFRSPRDVLTICLGETTYARFVIIVNATLFELRWDDHVTLEICSITPPPANIWANEGMAKCPSSAPASHAKFLAPDATENTEPSTA